MLALEPLLGLVVADVDALQLLLLLVAAAAEVVVVVVVVVEDDVREAMNVALSVTISRLAFVAKLSRMSELTLVPAPVAVAVPVDDVIELSMGRRGGGCGGGAAAASAEAATAGPLPFEEPAPRRKASRATRVCCLQSSGKSKFFI